MAKVLLVGERDIFLDILCAALKHEGINVSSVHDPPGLKESLEEVDLVIFEHVEPMDLYTLNPRTYGFSGPVVLLADYVTTTVSELLAFDHFLQKPFRLADVRQVIQGLLPE